MALGRRTPRQAGFTLVAVLCLVALLGLSLAAAGPLWSQDVRREREREMLRVGLAYAHAIEAYRSASPGAQQEYPPTVQALLLDTRLVGTVRHLRRAYGDPVHGGSPWGLLRDGAGRIVGVHSLSDDPPLAQGTVVLADRVLPPATRYSDWNFTAQATP